jgi:hypothetical protein
VDAGTSITDGTTLMAAIDWPAAIVALSNARLPWSGGERRVLRLAASLADGIPVDPRDAFTGMDTANVDRAVQTMPHAEGRARLLRASLARSTGRLLLSIVQDMDPVLDGNRP